MKAGKRKKRKMKISLPISYASLSIVFVLSLPLFFATIFLLFPFLEPNLTVAVNDDVVASLSLSSEITISSPADVNLGNLSGISGGSVTSGDVVWAVTTSNSSGYFLNLKKNALMSTGGGGTDREIADYAEAVGGTPDYSWSSVGSGNEALGFAPSYGSDIVQKFKNNGSVCNQAGGSVSAGRCWIKIPNTPTSESIAYGSEATGLSGTETAIKIKVEIGANNYLEGGTYSSTLTATAGDN